MNIVKKILDHNKKCNLQFDEKKHIYTIDGDTELESVTSKLKNFFPFDAEKVAMKVADFRGVPYEIVLEEWKKIRENGTHTHSLAEKLCNGNKLCAEELSKVKHVVQFLEDHPHFKILGCEVMVFSKKYKVAGTVDIVLLNKEDDKLYILDWKTSSKEIEKNQYWEMAKGALKEIPHNKFHNYSMQLSIYMMILKEEYGIEVYNGLLVHLRDNMTYRVIEPTDLLCYTEEVLESK